MAHSFGGCLAVRYADAHPGRVTALGLFNTAGSLPRTWALRLMEAFSGQADLVRRHFPWMVSTEATVATGMLRHTLREWNCWDAYERIRVPSLLVLGALDPLIPLSHGRRVAHTLKEVRLHILPMGGHVAMLERPRQVNEWLEGLLKAAAPAREIA